MAGRATKSGTVLIGNLDAPNDNVHDQTARAATKKLCTDSVDNFVIKPPAMRLSHCFVTIPPPVPKPRAPSFQVPEFPTDCVDKLASNDNTNHSSS